ncbi:3-oxo-tetronate kinase [Rhizobium tumorigenes]|uniref:3-oxo-tetronate kinase n=1 Tax=Rhizobium tumorigenes TaxID=2041385 RepID=A0AAF1KQ67_9HYPH|nr:3-oxo-tetronate kinase [Rhizobium tumorigenes]WFR99393.1 four-carbon acid sugar kinase family protein [Rhizobium tumorigenes]
MLIGAIADDITGATDLCLMLSRAGLRTVQRIGVPAPDEKFPNADAVVIALKSRSIPADEAVDMSCAAARALLAAGAEKFLFKYCSTFDSTDEGNIGPVTEALMTLLDVDFTIACPSFPAAGRTVYKGHLFVGDQLLSDSPLKDHPLNPMTDANIVRVLGRQTSLAVGLVDINILRSGQDAISGAFAAEKVAGRRIVIVDTLADTDLHAIGQACADMRLVTGGSGIGLGLAEDLVAKGRVARRQEQVQMAAPAGRAAILAGSCSVATRGQIEAARHSGMPTLALDVNAISDGRQTASEIADWALAQDSSAPVLMYSSADPAALADIQASMGRHQSGALVETTLAEVATHLKNRGFTKFLVAGGETSGAIVAGLQVAMLEIGPEIDPGVPWTRSINGPDLALALKSGNFGTEDFFLKAWHLLRAEHGNA